MTEGSNQIVQKLWSYCNVLRDDGLSYQDYLEQLTTLLFLKMADERAVLLGIEPPIPPGYRWADLAAPQMEGARLEAHYRETLEVLGKQGGLLGLIFRKAQNKIQDPAKLRQLVVELIGKESWSSMSVDVKDDAYEGLLEKNAQDIESGAGQYFTPRALIGAIVDCLQPRPGEIVVDPACGTGGFLLAAHDYVARHYELDRDQKRHLRYEALRGVELVDGVTRLCAINLSLHGIGPDDDAHEPPIGTDDALRAEPGAHAGKANVLFFDRKPGSEMPWTRIVWVYDLPTKERPTTRADLGDFVECYRPGDRHNRTATWSEQSPEGASEEILTRDKVSLDLFWLRDESLEDSASLPEPHVLAAEIADDLRAALEQIEDVLEDLQARAKARSGRP